MKELRELVSIVQKDKIKNINILDLKGSADTKVVDLYLALVEEKVQTDADARALFGRKDQSPGALSNVKRRLREQLINTLFFIDVKKSKFTDRQQAYFETQRLFAAVNLLLFRDAQINADWLLKKILKQAQKYEFNDLVLEVARKQRLRFCTKQPDPKRFLEMDELCKEAEKTAVWIALAERHFTHLCSAENAYLRKDRVRLKGLSEKYWRDLKEAFEENSNIDFHKYAINIRLFRHTIFNDFDSCVSICKEEIELFKEKPYAASAILFSCYYHLMADCLQRGDFTEGKTIAEQAEAFVEAGGFNWFLLRELLFFQAMLSGNYQEGYQIYLEAINHVGFAKLHKQLRASWSMYRAYLLFLVKKNLLQPVAGDSGFSAFDTKKFRQETRQALLKKAEVKLAAVIIQLLFAAMENDLEFFTDYAANIRRMLSRHQLIQDDARRPRLFIDLLLLTPLKSHDLPKYELQTARLFTELQKSSRANENPAYKLEVIPFEVLWGLI
ncbi:MAG: hypothetical protein AAFN92_03735 [Bacteroidota bacterium]